jgi:hypothetical protein
LHEKKVSRPLGAPRDAGGERWAICVPLPGVIVNQCIHFEIPWPLFESCRRSFASFLSTPIMPYGRGPTRVASAPVVTSAYILQHTSVCWFQGFTRAVRLACRPCRLSPDPLTQASTPGCGGGVCIPVSVTVSLPPLTCVMSIALEMHARDHTLSTQSCRRRHSTTVDVCHFRRPVPEANFFWGVPV